MGITACQRIQLGKETTPGTAVAATHLWRGTGTLSDESKPATVKENVGYLFSRGLVYVPRVGALVKMGDTPAAFENLAYILAASIENTTSGTADGSGSGYVWQFDAPISAANTIATFTLEAGDDVQAYEVEYGFVEEWGLKAAKGGELSLAATWRGRQATEATFTSLTPADQEAIAFSAGKLYLDDDGGTIGTTQITNAWLGMELKVPSGWKALFTGDGNKYFSTIAYVGNNPDAGGDAITGKLLLVNDAAAQTELAAARSGAIRLCRMIWTGSALDTPGSYTHKMFRVDLAIQYTDVPEPDDNDGLTVLDFPFRVVLNAAGTLSGQFLVVNEESAL